MKRIEDLKIKEIDEKIRGVRSLLEGILPIYHQVDRKKKSLETQIHILENEKVRLSQGQMLFDLDF